MGLVVVPLLYKIYFVGKQNIKCQLIQSNDKNINVVRIILM